MTAPMPPAAPLAAEPLTAAQRAPISRRRRAAALAIDLAAGLAALLLALIVAVGWLFARSAWGGRDAADGDTAIAFALLGAAPPAWVAWLALRLVHDAATAGERAAGLRVEVRVEVARGADRAWRRALRLATHPWGAAGWAWLALLAAVAEAPWLALALAIVAAAVALAGVASAALLIARPGALAIHDRVAGTRLVRR